MQKNEGLALPTMASVRVLDKKKISFQEVAAVSAPVVLSVLSGLMAIILLLDPRDYVKDESVDYGALRGLFSHYRFNTAVVDVIIICAVQATVVLSVASFVLPFISTSIAGKSLSLTAVNAIFALGTVAVLLWKIIASLGSEDGVGWRRWAMLGWCVVEVSLTVLSAFHAVLLHFKSRHSEPTSQYDEPLLPQSSPYIYDELSSSPDDETKPKDSKKTAKKPQSGRLLSLAQTQAGLLFGGTTALFISSISSMLVPGMLGRIIDSFKESHDKSQLDLFILIMVTAFSISAAFTFVRAAMFTVAGERVVRDLRKDLFAAIIAQEIGFFDVNRTGELINRLSADTTLIQSSTTVNISIALRNIAMVVIGLVILFLISWKLSLVMLAVVPFVAIGAVVYGRYVRTLSKNTQTALAKSTEKAEEAISSARVVRSFSQEPYETMKYGERVDESYKLGVKAAIASGSFQGGVSLMANMAIVLVLWYGGRLVISGDITTGSLLGFLLYTLYIGFSLAALSSTYGDFLKALGASVRVFELMDRTPRINIEGGYRPSNLEGKVELKNVDFSYPSRKDVQVLKNISLTVDSGRVLAIVGSSGGGKSSVVNLIERFYDPCAGGVMIDGKDLREYDPVWLHTVCALVSQEPVLFATSIRENIAYGISHVSDERFAEVCRQANCDFIQSFPEKENTIVGERGIQLSGGQKQRVAIARALLRDPKILLLDEATSALDSESEHLVQEAIDRLMRGRTTIVIAHRLSTVQGADKILVVKDGGIVESGTHQELLGLNGVYSGLVKRQLQEKN